MLLRGGGSLKDAAAATASALCVHADAQANRSQLLPQLPTPRPVDDYIIYFPASHSAAHTLHTLPTQENKKLLEKLVKIQRTDTQSTFKPFLGRSTFQWAPGLYFDPTTNTRCVDHHNRTMHSSPRSVHHRSHHANTGALSYAHMQQHIKELNEVGVEGLRGVKGVGGGTGSTDCDHAQLSTLNPEPLP